MLKDKIYLLIEKNYEEYLLNYELDQHTPLYIFNHLFRVILQRADCKKLNKMVPFLISAQNDDGSWGSSVKLNNGLVGVTATCIQMLFWYNHIISNERKNNLKEFGNSYDGAVKTSIQRGIDFIKHSYTNKIYWEETNSFSFRKHGILDINHYILQAFYYTIKYGDWIKEKNWIIERYDLLSEFFINNQANDGGWHEIGKVRFRTGTTADALRGLLPNIMFSSSIESGVMYLINNQHPEQGYWAAGNIDKMFDALRTLLYAVPFINSRQHQDITISRIHLGVNFVLSNFNFDNNLLVIPDKKNIEEVCDLLTLLIDYKNCAFDNYDNIKEFF
jgi:predicted RNA-binding protein YlqC (UPF0109 family)